MFFYQAILRSRYQQISAQQKRSRFTKSIQAIILKDNDNGLLATKHSLLNGHGKHGMKIS